MARQKKTINYTFDDGDYQIDATFSATCTVTGEKVLIYHKNLIKLIEEKYKNNFGFFIKNYISPTARRDAKESVEQDPNRLNKYAEYLIICYKESLVKNDQYTTFICAERFERHFKRDITQFINDSTTT